MSTVSSLSDESLTSKQQEDSPSSTTDLSFDKHHDSLPWILHHLLEREIPDELPLRIMFSFNSGEKLPSLKDVHRWWNHEEKGRMIIEFLASLDRISPSTQHPCDKYRHPQDRFMDIGNEDLLDIDFNSENPLKQSSRSQGLPPDFVQQFCLKVFTPVYQDVDFDQALTAIDYLRDYEFTRRRLLRSSAARFGVTKHNWKFVLRRHPRILSWVTEIQDSELEIEGWYANIFIGLRIWTMVNELRGIPFYKPNVLAMLNTLFPPSVRELPNSRIKLEQMHRCRASLYKYIGEVESNGSGILDQQFVDLVGPDGNPSWKEVRTSLESYFELARQMMDQACIEDAISHIGVRDSESRGSRSVSEYSSDRPGTWSSANSSIEDSGVWRMINTPKHRTPSNPIKLERPDSRAEKQQIMMGVQANRHSNQSMPSQRSSRTSTSRPATPICIPHEAFIRLPEPYLEVTHQGRGVQPNTMSNNRPSPLNIVPATYSPSWDGQFVTDLTPSLTPTLGLGSAKTLPSDNFDFLNRPFGDRPFTPPTLKKKASSGNLFSRKSSTMLRKNHTNDNALGIAIPLSKSTDSLSRFSDAGSRTNTMRSTRFANLDISKETPSGQLKKAKSISSMFLRKKKRDADSPCACCPPGTHGRADPPVRPPRPSQDGRSTRPSTSPGLAKSITLNGGPAQKTQFRRPEISTLESDDTITPVTYLDPPGMLNLRHATSAPALRQKRTLQKALHPPVREQGSLRSFVSPSSPRFMKDESGRQVLLPAHYDERIEGRIEEPVIKKKRSFWKKKPTGIETPEPSPELPTEQETRMARVEDIVAGGYAGAYDGSRPLTPSNRQGTFPWRRNAELKKQTTEDEYASRS